MDWCPHCNIPYDTDNETQPCCGMCGHPITCGCNQSNTDYERYTINNDKNRDDHSQHRSKDAQGSNSRSTHKGEIGHDVYIKFHALLEEMLKTEKDWHTELDSELAYKDDNGDLITKKHIIIKTIEHDSNIEKVRISIYNNGSYRIQGTAHYKRLGLEIKKLLKKAADNLAQE